MNKEKITSLWNSYKTTLEIAQDKKSLIKKSYLYFIISFIFQGLAFAFFYPLLNAIFSDNFDLNKTLFLFCVIVILSIFSFIFKWLANSFNYSGDLVETTHNLRVRLGEKIKNIPLQKLYSYKTGELNSILVGDVDASVLHIGVVAGMFFEITVVPLVIIVATFFIDPTLAILLLIAIFLAIPIYKWSRKETKFGKIEVAKANATLESDTIEYLQGLHILRVVNQIGQNSKKLQESIFNVKEVQKKGLFASSIPMIIMNTLIEFLLLFTLTIGTILILKGELTLATLLALLIILSRLSEPLANFLAITAALDIMEAGFKNIKKLLDEKEFETQTPIQKPKNFDITFDNVSFNYDSNNQKALQNVSFSIKENSLTAIVGPSGSGKTTITKLITRYADPSSGTIKIGNINIRQIKQQTLMSYISIVFQDVYLFDDTIFNNIKMGKPNATKKEVLEASKKAYAHEFISKLPKGYSTKVGEIGGSLSGGEKQRISIARAILKESPIVILDEPTSALDTQSELVVKAALDKLIKNRTVIVIAHRLKTISHANNILVIEDGKIKESGTHEDLILTKGRYYFMFESQKRAKE